VLTTIFTGARICDGTGTPAFTTDVATAGDRIAAIGDCSDRDAVERIDARGFVLAPGFIDVHSHSDELWLVEPRCTSKVFQGVTLEIAGNCGTSVAPLFGTARERKQRAARVAKLAVEWQTFDEFFSLVQQNGVSLNVASLVGNGTTRGCVSGDANRRLTAEERTRQEALVREAVDHGALGLSSGLIYEPSRYADVDELAGLSAIARDAGAPLYASHLRDEGDELLAAVDEALAVGARADVHVQFSHHKAAGRKNWGKVHRSLERIDAARMRGARAAVDVYPYVAMWTDLGTILPEAVREGSDDAVVARLDDPEIAAAVLFALNRARSSDETAGDTWHDILITDVESERNAHVAGMRMDAFAASRRLSPARAAIQLLIEERMAVQCAFFAMSEDDVATIFSAAFACVGSDASIRGLSGVTARGVPHPRAFGTFPRVFGRFVRGRPVLSLEEAVRRMTGLPAAVFGLRDRGIVAPGAFADLVLFDPATIRDTATYERPFALPEGLPYVYVNGECVVRRGDHTGARPGRVLRAGR
jgi:N-acyl-D-amino-acid deacylase